MDENQTVVKRKVTAFHQPDKYYFVILIMSPYIWAVLKALSKMSVF